MMEARIVLERTDHRLPDYRLPSFPLAHNEQTLPIGTHISSPYNILFDLTAVSIPVTRIPKMIQISLVIVLAMNQVQVAITVKVPSQGVEKIF